MSDTEAQANTTFNRSQAGPVCAAAGPSLGLVLASSLLGWFVLVATAPWSFAAAGTTLLAAAVLFGFGQTLLHYIGPRSLRDGSGTLLALPIGLIVACSIAQACHHNGLPAMAPIWAACLGAVPGWVIAANTLRRCCGKPLPWGYGYIAVILLTGVVFYGPLSRLDSLQSPDGSMRWVWTDSPNFEAMTGVLKADPPPLRNPGLGEQIMGYHYGRLALASDIARLFKIREGDWIARGNHALALLAMISAAIRVGWLVGRNEREKPLAGVLAVVLTLWLPSFLAHLPHRLLLVSPLKYVKAEIEFGTCDVRLPWDYFLSWAVLWGGILLLSVVALLLQNQQRPAPSRTAWPWAAMLLSVLGISVNGVAGAVCLAIVVLTSILEEWRDKRSYAFAAVAAVLFLGAKRAFGLDHVSMGRSALSLHDLAPNLAKFGGIGLIFLLHFRTLSLLLFDWGTRKCKLVLGVAVAVFSGMFIVFILEGYPIFFMSVILSCVSAGPAAVICLALVSSDDSWTDIWLTFLNCLRKYLAVVGTMAALLLPIGLYPLIFRVQSMQSIYGATVLLPATAVAALVLSWIAGRMRAQSWAPTKRSAAAVLVCLFLFALSGNWTLGRLSFSKQIVLDGGRVASLQFLRDTTGPGTLVATTKHGLEGFPDDSSYVYGATSQRYMFMEGTEFGYAQVATPDEFKRIVRQNETLFTTADPVEARAIVEENGITHILLEPGQQLGFPVADAPWLHVVKNPGTMTILEVDAATSRKHPSPRF